MRTRLRARFASPNRTFSSGSHTQFEIGLWMFLCPFNRCFLRCMRTHLGICAPVLRLTMRHKTRHPHYCTHTASIIIMAWYTARLYSATFDKCALQKNMHVRIRCFIAQTQNIQFIMFSDQAPDTDRNTGRERERELDNEQRWMNKNSILCWWSSHWKREPQSENCARNLCAICGSHICTLILILVFGEHCAFLCVPACMRLSQKDSGQPRIAWSLARSLGQVELQVCVADTIPV